MTNFKKLKKQERVEIKSGLAKYKHHMTKKLTMPISIFAIGSFLLTSYISLFIYGSLEELIKNIGTYLFLILTTFLPVILSFFCCKKFLSKERKVTDIVTISGYLEKETEVFEFPLAPRKTLTLYKINIVNSSKPLKTTFIAEMQYDVVSKLLSYEPNKLYTVRAAVCQPTMIDKLITSLSQGCLLLLPVEDYIEADSKLKKYEDDNWQAPLELGHRPEFITPRQGVIQKEDTIAYEAPLSPNMDFIKFDHLDYETLRENDEDTETYSSIKNVINYIDSEPLNNFMDLRTSAKTIKDRKSPHYLFYFGSAYLLNYLFMDYWSVLGFWINICLSTLLLIICIVKIFFPLRINLPIRFHRKNKEIYVSTNKSLYKIPWDKSDFSIIARQTSSNVTYDLTLWLDPQFDINHQSDEIVPYTLFSAENIHGRTYFYWDYINRYMSYAPYFDSNKNELVDKRKNESSNPLVELILLPIAILMFAILFIYDPFLLRNRLNPFRSEWPKIVKQWSEK